MIRINQAINTGGSTVVNWAVGIVVGGPGARI